MSKEKFTPGPWRVRKIAEFDIYKNASLFVLANDDGIIKMGKDAKEVASMPNLHHYPDEVKTIYANAYLIAAAPEMYELLDRLKDTLASVPLLQSEIENVLKKARGEK